MSTPIDIRPAAVAPPHPGERRNFRLGVANATLVRLGMAFVHPSLVLAAFVFERTGSNFYAGLVTALWAAGLMWPQLYLSSLIEHRPRKKPFYVAATVLRITLLAGLAAVVFASGANGPGWLFPLFFGLYFLYSTAHGCAVLPFLDMVGQSIPVSRRGGFFAYRGLLGGLTALVGGLVIAQPILHEFEAPLSYGLLLVLGVVVNSIGWLIFVFAREEDPPKPAKPRRIRQILASGSRMLREDGNYRLLFALRVLFRFNTLGIAFYVPYGIERLGALHLSGLFVGCISLSRLASSLTWGSVSDRHGNRRCLSWAGVFFVLSPLAALTAPHLPGAFAVNLPFMKGALDLPLVVYLLALCCFGFAQEANVVGINAFLLEAAPNHRRPSYIAFLNTVAFPFTFLPALAGALIGGAVGRLDVLFGVVTVAGLCYLGAARRLTEVREATRMAMPAKAEAKE